MSMLLGVLFFVLGMVILDHPLHSGIFVFMAGLCYSFMPAEYRYWRKKWQNSKKTR